MTRERAAADAANHPSPHRGATSLFALFYGLIAAPCAWALGQIANSTLAQEACFPGTEPRLTPAFGGVHLWNTAILLVILAVCASGAVTALRIWRRTRREHPGDKHDLLEIGEGRTRFMAIAGLLTSVGFFIGTLFSIPALLFVAAC